MLRKMTASILVRSTYFLSAVEICRHDRALKGLYRPTSTNYAWPAKEIAGWQVYPPHAECLAEHRRRGMVANQDFGAAQTLVKREIRMTAVRRKQSIGAKQQSVGF